LSVALALSLAGFAAAAGVEGAARAGAVCGPGAKTRARLSTERAIDRLRDRLLPVDEEEKILEFIRVILTSILGRLKLWYNETINETILDQSYYQKLNNLAGIKL
jgi:hypothetical protein